MQFLLRKCQIAKGKHYQYYYHFTLTKKLFLVTKSHYLLIIQYPMMSIHDQPFKGWNFSRPTLMLFKNNLSKFYRYFNLKITISEEGCRTSELNLLILLHQLSLILCRYTYIISQTTNYFIKYHE